MAPSRFKGEERRGELGREGEEEFCALEMAGEVVVEKGEKEPGFRFTRVAFSSMSVTMRLRTSARRNSPAGVVKKAA